MSLPLSHLWIVFENGSVVFSTLLFYLLLAGLLAIALSILLAQRWPSRRRVFAFRNESGSVAVTHRALTELVQQTCASISAISRPRIIVKVVRERIDVEISLRLKSQGRIAEIQSALRKVLEETLVKNLGFKTLGEVSIIVEAARPPQGSIEELREAGGTGEGRAYIQAQPRKETRSPVPPKKTGE